jgi:hypothetical protein
MRVTPGTMCVSEKHQYREPTGTLRRRDARNTRLLAVSPRPARDAACRDDVIARSDESVVARGRVSGNTHAP